MQRTCRPMTAKQANANATGVNYCRLRGDAPLITGTFLSSPLAPSAQFHELLERDVAAASINDAAGLGGPNDCRPMRLIDATPIPHFSGRLVTNADVLGEPGDRRPLVDQLSNRVHDVLPSLV